MHTKARIPALVMILATAAAGLTGCEPACDEETCRSMLGVDSVVVEAGDSVVVEASRLMINRAAGADTTRNLPAGSRLLLVRRP